MEMLEHRCLMGLKDPSGATIPVPTRLSYTRHDPYAVRVDFHFGGDTPVTWVFARDLLAAGTLRASGQGDVRAWPTRSGRRALLNLRLSSSDGHALLTGPLQTVARWLEGTYRLVPPGRESRSLHLDDELSRLLGEAA